MGKTPDLAVGLTFTVKSWEEIPVKTVLLLPYFGKLPAHFSYFVQSCAKNPNFTWLIFTDDKSYQAALPSNVKINHMTFSDFRQRVQSKFDFTIFLDFPIKICDFRPCFGLIFEEEIKGYDFWGHCDLDLIWGNLDSFIPQAVYLKYDKIFARGHLSLYKNNDRVNQCFRGVLHDEIHHLHLSYKDILSSHIYCFFDESNHLFDIHHIMLEKGDFFYQDDNLVADLIPGVSSFILHTDKKHMSNRVFTWEDGRLYDCHLEHGELVKREYGYCHFQEREIAAMPDRQAVASSFLLTPQAFYDQFPPLTPEKLVEYCSQSEQFERLEASKNPYLTRAREVKNALKIYFDYFQKEKQK